MENKEQDATFEKNAWEGDTWILIFLMLIFVIPFGSDHQTREELAELKGKVSVLEKIALTDRRN